MSEATAGAAAGTAPSLTTAPATAPATTTAAPNPLEGAPAWMKDMNDPEIIEGASILKRFQDVPSLAKALVHSQRMIGQDKIPIPGKNATAQDWQQVFRKLGLPEDAAQYKIEKPKDSAIDDEFMGSLVKKGMELNILPHQMQELLGFLVQAETAEVQGFQAEQAKAQENGFQELRQEWGQAFDSKVRQAQLGLKQFADEKTMAYLSEHGLDKDPMLFRLFAQVGASLKGDTFKGESVSNIGVTPSEARSKMEAMLADPKGAYRNNEHPGHRSAVEEYMKLSEAAHAAS